MPGSVWKKVQRLIFEKRASKPPESEYDPELVRFFLGDGFRELKSRYGAFKELLSENNAVLSIINDLQQRVGSQLITLPHFERETSRLLDRILAFVRALNDMCRNKYAWLLPIAEGIKERIDKKLDVEAVECCTYSYPLKRVSALMAQEVGGKAANLGEVRNILNLPTPDGFVLTSLAFRELVEHNSIEGLIERLTADLEGQDELKIREISAEIQKAILEAEVPDSVRAAIDESLGEMKGVEAFAVRSSAIGEDGSDSFAGQFRSVLNVPRGEILRAYKEVLASLYGERAIQYRLARGIPQGRHEAMAVLVLEMIPADSSGVLYTANPANSDFNQTFVTAVWGLGKYAVDGSVPPDEYVLDRGAGGKLIEDRIRQKARRLVADPLAGRVREEEVDPERREKPCLDEEHLKTLYEFGQVLERHFGLPQDVEWSMDDRGWAYVLQSRPLELAQALTCPLVEVEETPLLSGEPISQGVVSGPVFVVRDRDIPRAPRGAILVVKVMDPEFAKLIPMSSGLIAETGSAAAHLATVAREFQKPAITDAKAAAAVLGNEEIITLDAARGKVYRGRIDSLLKTKFCEVVAEPHEEINLPLIKDVVADIVPLTLINIPSGADLEVAMGPRDFRTVHDIVRFVHEVSVREMFLFGGKGETGIAHIMIDPKVPLTFYVINVEEGLDPRVEFKRRIDVSDVTSIPFMALWRGMANEDVSWAGAPEFDLGGFFSVLSRSFVQWDITEKGGKAYAILSKNYLNIHCRLAYHFAVVDAVLGDIPVNNYVAFKFGGGGAGADGRMRRALLLKDILEAFDFRVEVKGDLVTAIFRGGTARETERRLDQLGRLMGFTRQLDMSIRDEDKLEHYIKAFLEGRYSPEP